MIKVNASALPIKYGESLEVLMVFSSGKGNCFFYPINIEAKLTGRFTSGVQKNILKNIIVSPGRKGPVQ